MNVIAAILMFSLIVMFHELGHFLVAKACGIGVTEFAIGMGPKLISMQRGQTRYSLRLLPFGGFCQMVGEDEANSDPSAFCNKPVLARIAVVFAGPLFNFIMAFLFSLVLVWNNGYTNAFVEKVWDNAPAQEAGLQAGDRIEKINGHKVHSYHDVQLYMMIYGDQEVTVTYERADESGNSASGKVTIVPAYSEEMQSYWLGIQFRNEWYKIKNPVELVREAAYEVEYYTTYVFDSLYMMAHRKVGVEDLSGPVGIVSTIDQTVDEVSEYGWNAVLLTLIDFAVLLSANLGVMNLLPIPALDGGRLLFLLIELIRRKPIDRDKEGMVHLAGMALLMALMVFVLFNDVRKLF